MSALNPLRLPPSAVSPIRSTSPDLRSLLRVAAEKLRSRGLRRVGVRVAHIEVGSSVTWCQASVCWLPEEPAARLVVYTLDGAPLVRSRLDDWSAPDDSPSEPAAANIERPGSSRSGGAPLRVLQLGSAE